MKVWRNEQRRIAEMERKVFPNGVTSLDRPLDIRRSSYAGMSRFRFQSMISISLRLVRYPWRQVSCLRTYT